MSTHRINVGVYISARDLDIAAWFNLIRSNGGKPSKWVSAIIAAEQIERTLDIGAVCSDFPGSLSTTQYPRSISQNPSSLSLNPSSFLFGSGSTVAKPSVPKKTGWKHGWTVKDEQGNFIEGSVINLSFCRSELCTVIRRLKVDHLQVSSYIKALIRKYLAYEEEARFPKSMDEALLVTSEFIIKSANDSINSSQNHHNTVELTKREASPLNMIPPWDSSNDPPGNDPPILNPLSRYID